MDKKGRIITEETAYARMARTCSQKECAPFDITRKLKRMELPEPVIDKIINRLKKEKFLDEKRFIRSYIHDKLHFNKWGKRKIALFLKYKQLPQELIEEAFTELSDISFSLSLQPILEKKWKSVTGKSDYEKRGKLIRYALGRGFSMEEVMACMKQMEIGDTFNETE
ncbi:MAG: regulatory protein RecX [Proteiniphilum sp.]|uniref:regulatory protein RecX n=1 Tax=Proteiniphilum sp. TaxID=1926877 RepID=UPI002AB97DDC|nr:regulatory protein RecX [Proteiniphilum sp.]MDY9917750.1 regulatory protein RecX [Proteiniphilum sp.]